jgi:hypothetical protein
MVNGSTTPRAADIEAGPIFRPIDKAGKVRLSRLTYRSVATIVA